MTYFSEKPKQRTLRKKHVTAKMTFNQLTLNGHLYTPECISQNLYAHLQSIIYLKGSLKDLPVVTRKSTAVKDRE